jgi:arabinofuranan 3-O-arabinosyltransferase
MPSPRDPQLTVVVPTRNNARTIQACLASIRTQRDVAVQLIVIDNHSADGTADLARALADTVLVAGPERSAQRNLGARMARGPLVAFIDSDMVVGPDVAREAVDALADASVAGVVIPERAVGQGFWVRCRDLEKQLCVGDPRVEAARVYRTADVLAAGGYDEALHAHEDWELADRVQRHHGGRIVRTTAHIDHDEGRISLRRQYAKKAYYGRGLRAYVARDGQRALRRLARTGPLRRPTLLLARPHRTVGLAVLKAVELAGLLRGAAR